ncbi:glycoside hydrolase family 131 protein [Lentithecium fluviatile CBS 122367]|uniref:Glycoside hydrolase family 131 protein n=1 Tax=Lentithecium fluviatile CBS 122367 TaxID=1168545 RepID=A0A6G1J6V4_9PLEO|nr:glycoside hydrolase family 131 protein [Lentithecium fluviatile CBS 122367]
MFTKMLPLLVFASVSTQAHLIRRNCNDTAPALATNASSTIVWDGRVRTNATQADFDTSNGPFGPDFVKGQNASFSQLVLFPHVAPSALDSQVGAKPIEITITDASIFVPGDATSAQTAVRRTELSPLDSLVPNNVTTTGVKTLHVSLQPSLDHPLNTSHEYSLVFLERADFSNNIFMLRTGTLLGSNGSTKNDLVLQGNTGQGTKTLFTMPWVEGVWTNLGLKMDFDQNTIQVFASTANATLTQQTEPLPNDMSGNGQLHFGVNKNPTNPGADVLRSGFQESGILEGVVFGGLEVVEG